MSGWRLRPRSGTDWPTRTQCPFGMAGERAILHDDLVVRPAQHADNVLVVQIKRMSLAVILIVFAE